LKGIGRRARLKCSAAKNASAGRSNRFRGLHQLLFRLDRARTSHDDERAAADLDIPDPDYRPKLLVGPGHEIKTGELSVPVRIHDGAELSCKTTKKL
jgi:hypothetical protein